MPLLADHRSIAPNPLNAGACQPPAVSLVQIVLKELGEASPDKPLANLLTDVRRRGVVGEAGGAPWPARRTRPPLSCDPRRPST